jgi:hypothetical protein
MMLTSGKTATSTFLLKGLVVCGGFALASAFVSQAMAQASQPTAPVTAAPSQPAPAMQPTAPAKPGATAQPQDPKSRVVCRQRVEIGTRLGKRRECLTVREWEEIRARSSEEARRMQRNMGDKRS